jgi:Mg-chelatase subunit ChlD
VVFLLDVSRRIHFKTLLSRGVSGMGEMASGIVEDLSRRFSDAKFAVVTFHSDATVVRGLGSESKEVTSFLTQLNYAPVYESNMAAGLRKTLELLKTDPNAKSLVILATDGVTTLDAGMETTMADQLRAFGSTLAVIAVSRNYDQDSIVAMTKNDPPHLAAPSYQLDTSALYPFYPPCDRRPNVIAALREHSSQGKCPQEIVFIVDSSSSVSPADWTNMKNFLLSLVDKFSSLSPGVKFGGILYGNDAHLGFYLSENVDDIKSRLEGLQQIGGGRNLARALIAARQFIFKESPADKVVLLLARDEPSMETDATTREADRLRNVPVQLKALGISGSVSKEMLQRIAGEEKDVLRVPDSQNLATQLDRVAGMVCNHGNSDAQQQQQQD